MKFIVKPKKSKNDFFCFCTTLWGGYGCSNVCQGNCSGVCTSHCSGVGGEGGPSSPSESEGGMFGSGGIFGPGGLFGNR